MRVSVERLTASLRALESKGRLKAAARLGVEPGDIPHHANFNTAPKGDDEGSRRNLPDSVRARLLSEGVLAAGRSVVG
jgi:hypothetical protein